MKMGSGLIAAATMLAVLAAPPAFARSPRHHNARHARSARAKSMEGRSPEEIAAEEAHPLPGNPPEEIAITDTHSEDLVTAPPVTSIESPGDTIVYVLTPPARTAEVSATPHAAAGPVATAVAQNPAPSAASALSPAVTPPPDTTASASTPPSVPVASAGVNPMAPNPASADPAPPKPDPDDVAGLPAGGSPTEVAANEPAHETADADGIVNSEPHGDIQPAAIMLSAPTSKQAAPPLTSGEILYNQTHDASRLEAASWAVNVFKSRHELLLYYKGRLFKKYDAVFGRNRDNHAKLYAQDRRTPEGVYSIISKYQSNRFRWFLRLNYPNDVDRARYDAMLAGGVVPIDDHGRIPAVGSAIGIHGTDVSILNEGHINWTTGCISVENRDIDELARILPVGTVVIIKP